MRTRYADVSNTSAAVREDVVPRFCTPSVALLSDVHGNIDALRAVLAEIEQDPPGLVAFLGDTTWGTFPGETAELITALRARIPTVLIRGNADRAVIELTDGIREPETGRDDWMRRQHRPADVGLLRRALFQADIDVAGTGRLRVCHGSPRADIEALTPRTSAARMSAAVAGVDADILVTGHVHVQFDRAVDTAARVSRHLGPGSVGLPYHQGPPGARWARVGAHVELIVTPYDVTRHIAALEASDDPGGARVAALLRDPPTSGEVITYAENRMFSD